MIYLHLSSSSIEAIATKKGLLAKDEKISAVSRKVLSEKIPHQDLLENDQLATTIKELLKSAYPAEIKDNQVSTVLPDKQVIIKRFSLSGKKNTTDEVIEKAKEFLPLDITLYENFYKEINVEDNKEIVFTAIPLSSALAYSRALKNASLKLTFLSSNAFSIYALIKPLIGNNEKVIYLDINQFLNLVIFDENGPLDTMEKKATPKNINAEIKTLIKKLHEKNNLTANKLIIAGEKSLELSATDLSEESSITVYKMGTLLEELLSGQKITFDTGGVPLMYFDKVLGLINLAKMSDVPNFAVDLKNIKVEELPAPPTTINTSFPPEPAPSPVKMEVEEVPSPEPATSNESMLGQTIVEYRKSGLSAFFANRLVLTGLFAAIFLIIVGSYLLIGQSRQFRLPFLSVPSPTPTVIPTPSVTPSPTIDPNQKRSDVKLQVLNGTDKTGFAKSSAEKLEDLGYREVTIGNADRDDYSKTVIRVKEVGRKYLPLVISDLAKDFDTSTIETLADDSQYDFVIILGQK